MARRTPNLRLALPALAENVAVVRQAIAGLAAEIGAEAGLVDDIKTAVSEAATNVVVHAYPDDEKGPMEVIATADNGRLEIAVRDEGIGMQPRPVASQESLRIGLALIGALASGFEIRGEEGKGTEVLITFELSPSEHQAFDADPVPEPADGRTMVSVSNPEVGARAITNVLELLAARSDLSFDRLADTQLVADFLSHWSTEHADGLPLAVSVGETPGGIDVRVGPLASGSGARMLADGNLPGLGNTIERVVDSAEVTTEETLDGPADFLILRIGSPPGR